MKSLVEQQLRGFKASVNIDESQTSKPGTAIVWKESSPDVDGRLGFIQKRCEALEDLVKNC